MNSSNELKATLSDRFHDVQLTRMALAIEAPRKALRAELEKPWREMPAVYGLINSMR